MQIACEAGSEFYGPAGTETEVEFDVLAYTSFPVVHRRQIWVDQFSGASQQRSVRCDVVGIFLTARLVDAGARGAERRVGCRPSLLQRRVHEEALPPNNRLHAPVASLLVQASSVALGMQPVRRGCLGVGWLTPVVGRQDDEASTRHSDRERP